MDRSATLTIGQVAKLAGIRTSKLRYYESVGVLGPAPRIAGRRVYRSDVLDTLRLIQFAQEAGFAIDEIRHVLGGLDRHTPPSARWQHVAQRKLRDVGALIQRAQRMQAVLERLLSCECVQLSDCVTLCQPPITPLPRRKRS
jgi:MerR family transcriptional regulator, redox-sensitive transcriptional activator SoxR